MATHGLAALAAVLAAALSPAAGVGPHAGVAVLARAGHVQVLASPASRRTRVKSCSVQRSPTGGTPRRLLLPVACEQPPRPNLLLPPLPVNPVAALLGG